MTEFQGTLTLSNLEDVAKKIEEKLTGKTYTFVSANEFFEFQPEIRTNQKLKENSISFWFEDSDTPNYGGFNVNDSYGVWGLSTSQTDDKYDHTFDAPYIVIEHKQIKMTLLAPAGHKIYWLIAID